MITAILMIAATVTYFPPSNGVPGTIVTPSGNATVHAIPGGGYSVSYGASGKDWYSRNGFYCPEQSKGYYDKMPDFKGVKSCRLCRGSGKLGRNSCKCVRAQQKKWREECEKIRKANEASTSNKGKEANRLKQHAK